MNRIIKIVGLNLLILLLYLIVTYATNSGSSYAKLDFMVIASLVVAVHVFLTLLIACIFFIKGNRTMGSAYLLGALAVLLVGFFSCWGSIIIYSIKTG